MTIKRFSLLASLIILILLAILYITITSFPKIGKSNNIITLYDMYTNKITNYVGKKIFLKTKLSISDPQLIVFNTEDKLYDQMTSKFIYDYQDKIDRANFSITSPYLDKKEILFERKGNDPMMDTQTYFYKVFFFFRNKLLLIQNKYYILEGTLKYRDWLKVDDSNLNDPEFIEQSNNPIYWNQTFEFELDNIYEE